MFIRTTERDKLRILFKMLRKMNDLEDKKRIVVAIKHRICVIKN